MRLTDEQLREVLVRAEEIQRSTRSGAAWEAEREAILVAGEAVGLQRSGVDRALRERVHQPRTYNAAEGELVFARSTDGKYYVAEVLSAGPELCRVRFLRGGEHSIGVDEVRPASFLPGERLVANWPMWGPWTSTVVAYDERHRVLTVSDGWGSDAHISLIDVWLSPKDVADVDRRHLTVKLLVWGAAAGGILGSALTWFLLR
jgi:hypothetical protein